MDAFDKQHRADILDPLQTRYTRCLVSAARTMSPAPKADHQQLRMGRQSPVDFLSPADEPQVSVQVHRSRLRLAASPLAASASCARRGMALTIGPLKRIGRSFTPHLPLLPIRLGSRSIFHCKNLPRIPRPCLSFLIGTHCRSCKNHALRHRKPLLEFFTDGHLRNSISGTMASGLNTTRY